MFQAWEEGRGPCFSAADLEEVTADSSVHSMPSLARRIVNFGVAGTRHVMNGLRHVSDADFDARLQVCRNCSSCDVEQMICREQSCGCYLHAKARWESEACPRGLWREMHQDQPYGKIPEQLADEPDLNRDHTLKTEH